MVVLEKPPSYSKIPGSEEMLLSELQLEDMEGTVATFLRQDQDDTTRPIVENVLGVLRGMTPSATEHLVRRLIDDADWRHDCECYKCALGSAPHRDCIFLIGCFLLTNVPSFRVLGPLACNLGAELCRRISDVSTAVFNKLGALASTGILQASTAENLGSGWPVNMVISSNSGRVGHTERHLADG
ncbi:hypothetical protein CPB85DRAFT_221117 [Mucidula mucida]|nr:hypothetical protein CPB85DRAFT_221117 [Mucidula mucida]